MIRFLSQFFVGYINMLGVMEYRTIKKNIVSIHPKKEGYTWVKETDTGLVFLKKLKVGYSLLGIKQSSE